MKPKLPSQYSWLLNERSQGHLSVALSLYGVEEIKGTKHNPIILSWADELNPTIGAWYDTDEKAWCGLYVGICLKRAGHVPPSGFNVLRALEYARWGEFVASDKNYCVGDIGVFIRKGGGHVGFLVGEDDSHYHVLGGNQGDSVSFARISKDRIFAVVRVPDKFIKPKRLRRLRPSGLITENEA